MSPAALPPWLTKALRHPVASAAAMTLGIRIGQEVSRLRRGEIDRQEFEKRAAQHLGALGGTLTGVSLGWSLGRAVPGIGGIIGAFGGGLVGHLGGERFGRASAARVSRIFMRGEDEPDPETTSDASPAVTAEPVPSERGASDPEPNDSIEEPVESGETS